MHRVEDNGVCRLSCVDLLLVRTAQQVTTAVGFELIVGFIAY